MKLFFIKTDIVLSRSKSYPLSIPTSDKMQQCMGLKTDGARCDREETGFIHLHANHLHFCSIHWPVYIRRVMIRARLTTVQAEQHHEPGTCHKWVAGTHWCGNECGGNNILCVRHRVAQHVRDERNQRIHEEADRRNNAFMFYRDHNPPMTCRQVIDHVWTEQPDLTAGDKWNVVRRIFLHMRHNDPEIRGEFQFDRYWNWTRNGRFGPPPDLAIQIPPLQLPVPPPVIQRGLHAIARDPQNVHTRYVTEQTNKGLDTLLEASKSNKQMRAPDWFAAKWLVKSYGGWNVVVRVVNDMHYWYGQHTCKIANDRLYQRALDGLYLKIKNTTDIEVQTELYKRAFEECYESVGMCCEGHISRICNVLVGFDDEFAPPVPFGEILQNKMAAIYALEIDTEEKICQATAFFNEFAVPEAERAAWLEAF